MAKRKRTITDGTITCSQGRKQKKIIPFLPKDIIFNILIWLPAEFLHNHGKYVCRDWADIIRDPLFIKKHLLHANPKLFFNNLYLKCTCFVEMKGGKVRVSNLNREVLGIELASCEGVFLFYDPCGRRRLLVTNIVTMQAMELQFPSAAKPYFEYSCSMVYISQTGKFKVICPCVDVDGMCCWFVQTVGVDVSWRKLDFTIPLDWWKSCHLDEAKSIGGVIYWFPRCYPEVDQRILAIDLRDESIHCVRFPKEKIRGIHFECQCAVVEMENHLSCLLWTDTSKEVEVYILKDLGPNQWVEAFKLVTEIGGHRIWDRKLTPICWLDNGQVLVAKVFKKRSHYKETMPMIYNVKTGVMRRIKNAYINKYGKPLRHISSLLSW